MRRYRCALHRFAFLAHLSFVCFMHDFEGSQGGSLTVSKAVAVGSQALLLRCWQPEGCIGIDVSESAEHHLVGEQR